MDCSVKLVAYNTTEIYRAVYEPAGMPPYVVPSAQNFSTLFINSTLLDEYKNPIDGVYNSQWFSGYIGDYRTPRFSTTESTVDGQSWNYNQYCTNYSGCAAGYDVSIVCGFDVSVPYFNMANPTFLMYDTDKGYWRYNEDEYFGSKYTNNDVMRIAPVTENLGTAIDSSFVFRVQRPAEAMNLYQEFPEQATFNLYQSGVPSGPVMYVDIDPNDKSDLEWFTYTTADINAYNNVVECDFNLYNPLYNNGEYFTINWRAVKVSPASENMGTGYFGYYNNTQVTDASIYLSTVAISGDIIWLYLYSTPILSINPSSYNFPKSGGSIVINVSTSTLNNWTATEAYSWLSLTNSSSTGNGQFTITASQQVTGGSERSATVCVNSSAATVCVTITQDASIPVTIYRLYDGPGDFTYSAIWDHDEYGEVYANASFGFDSSRAGIYYDASLISYPSWISFLYPFWTTGSNISPYPYDADTIRPYPTSANTSTNARNGVILIRNNYGGQEEWNVTQSGMPAPPQPITDFTVDVSFIRTSWPSSTLTLNGNNSYITMLPVWWYVLKINNVSTNTIYFNVDASISVVGYTPYDVINYSFLNNTHIDLPTSIAASSTWQDTAYWIKNGDPWNSSSHTEDDVNSIWSDNYWSVQVYYSGLPYNNYYLGTRNAAPLREPKIQLVPSTWNFGTSGGTKRIDVSTDGNSVTNPYINWTVTESCTWLSLSNSTGVADGSFYINATQQTTGNAARSGKVTFSSLIPDLSVRVTQDASVVIITVPTVTTLSPITNISLDSNSASGGGNVTSSGGATVTARGVCWNTTGTPTIANSKTTNGSGTGSFTSTIAPLSPNTTFYVRAYATNSAGTGYGSQVSFVVYNFPTVLTIPVTNILATYAESGGNITNNGGSLITGKGVCWNKTGTPSVASADGSTANGTGIGVYTSNISGLDVSTRYYVRAYATNAMGISYGSTEQFITAQVPTITTVSPVTSITGTTAVSGGQNISTYGGIISSKGICWSTFINPTLASANYTINSSSAGAFTGYMGGLSPSTHYYVRAFVTTNIGTGFGQNVEFNTDRPPTVTTSAVTKIATISASCGGNVTADGGETVTARGVCWNTSTNPTTSNSKTTNGSGTGTFYSNITGLEPSTRYYVRAYATNSTGTGYGSVVQFNTLAVTDSISSTFTDLYFDATGYSGVDTVTITSSTTWYTQLIDTGDGNNWFYRSPTSGSSGQTSTISCDINDGGFERTGIVRFTAGTAYIDVEIHQTGI